MTIDKDKIKALMQRYDDDYKAMQKIRALDGASDDKALSAVFWELVREGFEPISGLGYSVLYLMGRHNKDYTGQDLLTVMHGFAKAYPKGVKPTHYGATHAWSSNDFAGISHPMLDLVANCIDKPDSAAALATGWSSLPDPYDKGLLYLLASAKVIPVEDLPEELLHYTARQALKNDNAYQPSWLREHPHPWPQKTWSKALIDAALSGGLLKSSGLVKTLLEYAPIEDLDGLFDRISYLDGYNDVLKSALAFADASGDVQNHLEARIKSLTGHITKPDDSTRTFPAFFVGFAYLKWCNNNQHTPPKSQDGFWEQLIEHFHINWSGSNFQEYVEELRQLLAAIPPDRLEHMFMLASEHHWDLVGAAPTERVVRATVDALHNWKGYDYQLRDKIAPAIASFGPAAIPVYNEALTRKKPVNNRLLLVEALKRWQHPDAIAGLVTALGDKSKGVRQEAISALCHHPNPDAVLNSLQTPLAARRKDARLGAATVLNALPASATRYQMAQTALAKEKVAAIIDLLEAIPNPGSAQAETVARHQTIIAALKESDGAQWTEFKDDGLALVQAFFQSIEEKHHNDTVHAYQSDFKHWQAMIPQMASVEGVRSLAIAMAPNTASFIGRKYLEALEEHFEDIPQTVSELICQGKWVRSPGAGKARSSFALLDAIQWLTWHREEHALDALLFGLTDRRSTITKFCHSALVHRADNDAITTKLIHLLTDPNNSLRARAAKILEEASHTPALEPLKAAAANEKNRTVNNAFQSAIAALSAQALDVAVFPDTPQGDADLDKALAALPSKTLLDAQDLGATVHWKSGAAMSDDALAWFVNTLCRESAERADERLVQVRARLNDADCHGLCRRMLTKAPNNITGWGLFIQPIIGSTAHIDDIGARLEELASSQRYKWGEDGVEAMARANTDEAIRWLDHWHRKTRRDALRWRSQAGLQRMATKRGITVEDLLDSAMSRFGFDPQGRRAVDYGGRPMTWILGDDGKITFENEKGKALKSLPAARKTDDAVAIAALKRELAQIRKELKRILKSQPERLERSMLSGRRWPQDSWWQRLPGHPVLRGLTRTIVFAHTASQDPQDLTPFLLNQDNQPTDHTGAVIALPQGGEIIVPHPIALAEAVREGFDDLIHAAGLRQPFDQLIRRLFTPAQVPPKKDRFDLELPLVTESGFFKGLRAAGYERGARQDAGLISDSFKSIGPWSIFLSHTSVSPEIMDNDRAENEVNAVTVHNDGQEVLLDQLPPAIYSEIVRDLHIIAGL